LLLIFILWLLPSRIFFHTCLWKMSDIISRTSMLPHDIISWIQGILWNLRISLHLLICRVRTGQ
jgi:hypothetical protein